MKTTWLSLLTLSLLAVGVFAVARRNFAQSSATGAGSAKRISLEEFDKLRGQTNYVILDVRSPSEFAAGHVPGATNLNVSASDFAQRVGALPKDKPYLVHCAAGARSARAVGKMSQMGFKELYDFSGGWGEWKKSGKPVEK